MTLDVAEIRKAVANQVRTNVAGLHCYWHQVKSPQFPCLIVLPAGDEFITYHETFGTRPLCTIRLEAELWVSATSPESGETTMAAYLSAGDDASRSVFDALESDRTFGGLVQTSITRTASAPEWVANTDAGTDLLRASLFIEALERRTRQ